jgi:hypothetical protein
LNASTPTGNSITPSKPAEHDLSLTLPRCPLKKGQGTSEESGSAPKLILSLFWLAVLGQGALSLWGLRFNINPDGLSYLEMAEKIAAGDLGAAINGYWSSGYALLNALVLKTLEPSLSWKPSVIALTNFAGLILATSSFLYLLKTIRRPSVSESSDNKKAHPLPAWFFNLFMALFFIANIFVYNTFSILYGVPDIYICACFFMATAFLFRISRGEENLKSRFYLGLVLGLGFSLKTIFFPLSLVFLVTALIFEFKIRYVSSLLVPFLLIVVPLIALMSIKYDRLTIGESGRLNYAWYVNGVSPYSSVSEDTEQVIFKNPTVYAFKNPENVTWPFWYDPAKNLAQTRPTFSVSQQLARTGTGFIELVQILGQSHLILLISLGVLLFLTPEKRLKRHWPVLLPSIVGILIYVFSVPLESRYLTPFFLVIFAVFTNCVRIKDAEVPKSLLVLILIATTAFEVPLVVSRTKASPGSSLTEGNWRFRQISTLKALGLNTGDHIAVLFWGSHGHDPFPHWTWVKYGGFKITAEIVDKDGWLVPTKSSDVTEFLGADVKTKREIIGRLKELNIKAVVGWVPDSLAKSSGLKWISVPIERVKTKLSVLMLDAPF